MISFLDRMLLANAYRAWIINKSEKPYYIADEPETFIVFLLSNGLLNEEKIKEFLKSA